MHIIGIMLIGLVAGALAKLLHPGKDPGGIIVTMLLGVAGSLLAGFIGRAVGFYRDPASGPGLLMSTAGALLVLIVYTAVVRWRYHHTA
jgi:uncharacterized membrane protein YeaQ/YmgE (transglycosylase-associated protein family)